MSAIVDEATDGLNRVNASDIETARNLALEDEMFAPVHEALEESSRLPDRVQQNDDGDDSILEAVQQMNEQEYNVARRSSQPVNDQQMIRIKLNKAETENIELQKKLSHAEDQIESLTQQKEQDDEDNGSSLIPHIKVTLIQFLRNVGITDRQNEDLLTIIFNMMEFTDTEI